MRACVWCGEERDEDQAPGAHEMCDLAVAISEDDTDPRDHLALVMKVA